MGDGRRSDAVATPYYTLSRRARFGARVSSPAATARPRFIADLSALVAAMPDSPALIARGAGGAGGDIASLASGREIDMTGLDRLIHFDPAAGVLRAQAGMRIIDCLAFLAPRGHTLPVIPAWSPTTLGGAVATDVHGANHDGAGAIGAFVRRLALYRTDGPPLELSPGHASGLFEATIGGLGLTGVIAWVELETRPIRSSMMDWEVQPFASLTEALQLFRESQDWVYRRCWLDAARPGRGRFERFRHAQDGPIEARWPQPLLVAAAPVSRGLANGVTTSMVTGFLEQRGGGARRRDYASVFFPFEDAIHGFANMFGRKGAAQYQAVLPPPADDALVDMLKEIKRLDDVFVLSGLMEFGKKASPGLMSFPREGMCFTVRTRALGERTHTLFARLDEIVRASGGRINPAIDARAPLMMMRLGYPNLQRFESLIDNGFRSDFMVRTAP